MDILKIDKNFVTQNAILDEYDWYDATSAPFELHGVVYDEDEGIFTRMPKDARARVSAHVNVLATYTSGGRLRFRTDSPYIAIYATEPCALNPNKGSLMTFCGFSLYANGYFCNTTVPESKAIFPEGDPRYLYAQKLILFTGIANDAPLARHLTSKYQIVKHFNFPDHHKFTRGDILSIRNAADNFPTSVIMTTEKDCQRVRDSKAVPESLKRK